MVETINLFNLIFDQILKISPNLLYKYTTLQDQIFNLIFLPHVVLFLFLFGFGLMIVPETKSKGLRYLVIAATYIFIVYQGWYGTFLLPLFQAWFTIMLIFGLLLFLTVKIIHPATAKAFGAAAGVAIGKPIGEAAGKGKRLEALEKELEETAKKIRKDKERLDATSNPYEQARLQSEISALEDKQKELEKAIENL